jgi:hypothetical protein
VWRKPGIGTARALNVTVGVAEALAGSHAAALHAMTPSRTRNEVALRDMERSLMDLVRHRRFQRSIG